MCDTYTMCIPLGQLTLADCPCARMGPGPRPSVPGGGVLKGPCMRAHDHAAPLALAPRRRVVCLCWWTVIRSLQTLLIHRIPAVVLDPLP